MTNKGCNRRPEHGYILLALLLIMVVGGSSLVLGGLSNRQSAYLASQAELYQQLEIAKTNLLAYVSSSSTLYSNAQGPGFFPCPDTDNDGDSETTCNPVNTTMPNCYTNTSRPAPQIGWLPEYIDVSGNRFTLSNYYQDSGGKKNEQQFWYVVAPRYVYHSTLTSSNHRARNRTSTSTGLAAPTPPCMRMYLDDAGEYVAFIIAPGEALTNQTRSIVDTVTTTNTTYTNYLDGLNGATNYYYYTSDVDDPDNFNDRIIGITLDEYVKAVGTRVAIESWKQLEIYRSINGSYPSSATNFRAELDDTSDQPWMWPNTVLGVSGYSAYDAERWSTDTSYTRDSVDTSKAIINFSGCTGIKFVIVPGGVSLDPSNEDSC